MEMQPPNPAQPPAQFVFAPPSQETEATFDFWGVLSRRKWLVFLGVITGLAVGGFYNSQTPTLYKSSSNIRIEPKNPQRFKTNPQDIYSQQNSQFDLRHDQLIGETNVVSRCLFDNQLDKLPSLRELAEGDKVQHVKDSLTVTQNREEPTKYEIKYTSINPDDARDILAALVDTYQEVLAEQYRDEKAELKELLERMNLEFGDDFKEKQEELQALRRKFPQITIAGVNLNQHQVKIGELQAATSDLQRKLDSLNLEMMGVTKAIEGGESTSEAYVWRLRTDDKVKKEEREKVADNTQALARIDNQLFLLDSEINELENKAGPGFPKVKALKSQRNELAQRKETLEAQQVPPEERSAIATLTLYKDKLEPEIQFLRTALRNNLEQLTMHTEKAAAISVNNQLLKDKELELERIREISNIAKEQLMQLTSEDFQMNRHQGFRFQTTEAATLGVKVWPILPVILAIGGLLGSLLGFGVGILVELADKTFHNPDEIIKHLQVPLIGHVPVIGQGKRYLVENSLIEPIVCTYHRPKSQVSEAFRAVRTALYFNTQGKEHSVIQVTSPTPGDGKSTLASNLAVSIAQSGKRVLLVDADMRRPRQHGTFGITSRVGFATVLSGQSDWKDTLFECEEIEGLTLMPCGAKPQNPAELSSSPQVKLLIEEMRHEFDFVIIDTPPLLAVTDPCPIAARVDGVILCLRIKKNVRVSAERAVELLGNLGASCLGLVVNGVGAQSGYGSQYTYGAYRAGYSYNGYGYGYGYGYGGKYYDEDQKGRVAEPRRLEEQTSES